MTTTSRDEAEPSDDAFPLPEHAELNKSFWQSLREGMLTFQRCNSCGNAWLPMRDFCPHCLSSEWSRDSASGRARLISWVVYNKAYHVAFEARLPYVVAVVELEEGPRMISNIIRANFKALRIDQPLSLVIEEEHGISIPRFTPVVTESVSGV